MINPDLINPVDYYNENCIENAIELLLKLKPMQQNSPNSLTYVSNKSDEKSKMILVNKNRFICKMENGLGMKVGEELSAFQMVQTYCFHKSFQTALNHVIYKIMGVKTNFIRVGISYHKKTIKRDRYGIDREELKIWNKSTIIDDLGKEHLTRIPNFDDFTIEPNNKDYKSIVFNNYNLYSPFSHIPISVDDYNPTKIKWTLNLIKHIFGEHYKLGLIYLKVLYDHPKQAMPILVLTSEERQTGKSTFIDWLTILFGANMTVINPQDISTEFNGAYAEKNIIAIEESRFDKPSTVEKLKALATQKTLTCNPKHIQQYSLPFFGKLIITSNDENKFSKVDNKEIRFWVRKVPTLQGISNHNILEDLTNEIPSFLHFLDTLPKVDLSRSRMVFTPEEIETKALANVKKESRTELHKEILILLDDFCQQNPKAEEIKFAGIDLKNKFFLHQNNYTRAYIIKTLKADMKLTHTDGMERYIPFEVGGIGGDNKTGTPYIFKNKYYVPVENPNIIDIDDNDVPF